MKSHFLVGITSEHLAGEALRSALPGQEEPWVLLSEGGDPIAYFNVGTMLDGEHVIHVQADVSGRHYSKDAAVVEVLRGLQAAVGGVIDGDA
jgi:hypothetical protein